MRINLAKEKDRVQLQTLLPPILRNANEWARHVAVVEYAKRKQLNFQGTGDYVLQTGDKAKTPSLEEVFKHLLNKELARIAGGQIKGAEAKWQKTVTEAAEKAGVTGVRVIRQEQNRTTGRV